MSNVRVSEETKEHSKNNANKHRKQTTNKHEKQAQKHTHTHTHTLALPHSELLLEHVSVRVRFFGDKRMRCITTLQELRAVAKPTLTLCHFRVPTLCYLKVSFVIRVSQCQAQIVRWQLLSDAALDWTATCENRVAREELYQVVLSW